MGQKAAECPMPGTPDENAAPIRVLLVDDSKLQRRVLSAQLRQCGYIVEEAESGEAALAMCWGEFPDLVLSDWMMPGMSGLEFCRTFRAMAGDRFAYFILLTSKTDRSNIARGLDAGADDFISKPVSGDELRARVNSVRRIIEMQRALSHNNDILQRALTDLQGLQKSLDDDLQDAKKLQQSLLPLRHKDFDGGALSLMLRSSGHVGGDLVGFFNGGPDELCIFGFDVSGHGISSAIMAARLAGYLSAAAPTQNIALAVGADGTYRVRPLAKAVASVNDLFLREMKTELFFTLLMAVVDMRSGKVRFVQAGHPHPIVQRADGRIERHGEGGLPVGLVRAASYSELETTLEPGDRLLILSDGVSECMDNSGNMLGDAGVTQILQRLAHMHEETVLSGLLWNLTQFAGAEDFNDDVSGILFEYHGPPGVRSDPYDP